MNVFDFDKTIYRSDATVDFYLHCLKRHPGIIKCLPAQLYGILKYKFHRCSKEVMKENFFCFLKQLKDVDKDIDIFIKMNSYKIQKWYLSIQEKTDVVISASPRFLIDRFSKETSQFYVIASEVDKETGVFRSKNCYGGEKVRRFKKEFPNGVVDKFYSDSFSDLPMAKLARAPYLVERGKVIKKWNIL